MLVTFLYSFTPFVPFLFFREVSGKVWLECDPKEDYGTVTFQLPGQPFRPNSGKKNATIGKLFMVRIFEEMYKLGYDFISSSDLAREQDTSTLFFRKVCENKARGACKVLCISPGSDLNFGIGSNDKIIMLRCPEEVEEAIEEAVKASFVYQVQKEDKVEVIGETLTELKLTGEPWCEDTEDSGVPSRQLLLLNIFHQIYARTKDWKFFAVTNIKGLNDALFFIQSDPPVAQVPDNPTVGNGNGPKSVLKNSPTKKPLPESEDIINKNDIITSVGKHLGAPRKNHAHNYAMVSLHPRSQLRLVDFRDPDLSQVINWTLTQVYDNYKPLTSDFCGATDFSLPGEPFFSCGKQEIKSRSMICAILTALNSRGWEVLTTIAMTRTIQDLSVFVLSKCEPQVLPYACISMTSTHLIQFIGFPSHDMETLRFIAHQAYAPGIADYVDETQHYYCLTLHLKGHPWSQTSSYSCHGKSMLLLLLVKAEKLGWQLMASADVSAKNVKSRGIHGPFCSTDLSYDVDSWFFRYVGNSAKNGEAKKPENGGLKRADSTKRIKLKVDEKSKSLWQVNNASRNGENGTKIKEKSYYNSASLPSHAKMMGGQRPPMVNNGITFSNSTKFPDPDEIHVHDESDVWAGNITTLV